MRNPTPTSNGAHDLQNFEKIKEMRLEMKADQKMKGSQIIYFVLSMAEIFYHCF